MDSPLKSFWNRFFKLNWQFGLFLVFIMCVPRFVMVLHANASGNYGYIGLVMFISAIIPFIFLTKTGLQKIGIIRPKNFNSLFVALLCGLVASIALYAIGQILYDESYKNWYRYIGKSYDIPERISQDDKIWLFAIMGITGMTFSPIGEELFFRGIVHRSFAYSIGDKKASLVDSAAFAITHISHFGMVFINGHWDFFVLPTIIWVASMYFLSRLFYYFRTQSDSILGAIICHAAFNLGMIYSIFYLL